VPPDQDAPSWSRARELPPAAETSETPAAAGLPATAVADAWTTQPGAAGEPSVAALHPRADHPHVFGDRIAAGVLLTLAAASMAGGGIFALVYGTDWTPTVRAVICGAVAAVLLAGAVVLRLVRGTDDLRGTLAIIGIAFAVACVVFAYAPDNPVDRDNLVKFALGAGVVTVLSWFAAFAVPSAVAAALGTVALPTAVGAGVWLALDSPKPIQVIVAALCIGLALALVMPRVRLLRPHPASLGWILGGAALVITLPAIVLIASNDPLAMAAGATAAAALLALAQRHRHLPAAVGAFAGLAYLELFVVVRRVGPNTGSPQGTRELIIFAGVGAVLAIAVAVAVVLQQRGRLPRRGTRPPVGLTELLLVAALALTLIALFTTPGNLPLNPTQLQSGSTATHTVTAATPS
jgi:hypothetical protein